MKGWSLFAILAPNITALVSLAALAFNIHTQRQTNKRLEREQASNVTIYGYLNDHAVFILENASNVPIYNVFVMGVSNNKQLPLQEDLTNCKFNPAIYGYEYIEVLPKLTLNIDFTKRFSTSDDGEHTVPKLLFTDSQNIQWRRLPNGHLEKCKYVNQLKKYGFSFTDAGSNQKHLDEVTD